MSPPLLDRVGALVDLGRRSGLLVADGDAGIVVRMLVGPLIASAILDGLLVDEEQARPLDQARRHDLFDRWLRAAGAR